MVIIGLPKWITILVEQRLRKSHYIYFGGLQNERKKKCHSFLKNCLPFQHSHHPIIGRRSFKTINNNWLSRHSVCAILKPCSCFLKSYVRLLLQGQTRNPWEPWLMRGPPGVNFINILRVHFLYEILAPKNFKPKTQLCKMLMKLTSVYLGDMEKNCSGT